MTVLPAELQLMLLSYCDRQAICALRQTSKQWFDITTEALFSSINVCYFSWSFDRLEELSRSRLAHRVKEVVLYSAVIGSSKDYDDFEQCLKLEIEQACRCMGSRGYVYYVPKEYWQEAYGTYQSYWHNQQQVFTSSYLQEFAASLKRLINMDTMRIRHYPEDDFDPRTNRQTIRWPSEEQSFHLAKTITTRSGDTDSPEMMPCLISCMSLKSMRKLTIHQQYNSSWNISDRLRPAVGCLEELDLEISMPCYNLPQRDTLAMEMLADIASFVRIPSLKRLSLVGTDPLRRDSSIFETALRSYYWPHLRSLRLHNILANTVLEPFFLKHRHTLKHLDLQQCSIAGAVGTLTVLPKLLRLTEIKIRSLIELHPAERPELYFFNGIQDDPEAQRWLLTGQGEVPVWEPYIMPEYPESGCFGVDYNADIICDEEFEYA